MSKAINKTKLNLATLWTAIISFSSKVFGQATEDIRGSVGGRETMYGVSYTPEPADPSTPIAIAIKIVQILLMAIIPIIGIINFIKIRKIDDKSLKNKRIKRTIITLLIILIAILLLAVAIWLLKKYYI